MLDIPRKTIERPLRVAATLRAAGRAHGAALPRVVGRAVVLRRRGWRLGEMSFSGLLDPREGRAVERWYVRPGEMTELQEALNPPEAVPLAEDKRLFAATCATHHLPCPALVALLERPADPATTTRHWAATLEREAPAEFVVKPADGTRGLGVRVLRRVQGGAVDAYGRTLGWAELARELAAEPWKSFLVQPRLRPHPGILELTGRDVLQTLRIVTLLGDGGRARILWAGLRMAAGDRAVDTFRSGVGGSLMARVDEDGTLAPAVGAAPGGFGVVRLSHHPHSGNLITGAAVPDWEAVRALAVRAAEAFSPLRAVGWDVAPSNEGPVLVEANAWWAPLPDPDGGMVPVRDALRRAAAEAARATAM